MNGFRLGYFYIDFWYLVLIVPAMLVSLWAQFKVNSSFKKYSGIANSRGLTGAQAAQNILSLNGVHGIRIERVPGNLTDHFDPKTGVIRLSDSVFGSASVAAVGVAAHEAGHAVQYHEEYAPIKLRSMILPVSRIGSTLSWPLLLIGIIFNIPLLVTLGIVFFSAAVLFQVITLPAEFNASKRAIQGLSDGNMLGETEIKGAKKVLSAAAMTYLAALAVSLAQLLRLILINNSRRR